MSQFEKLYPIFIISSILIGLLCGTNDALRITAEFVTLPLLMMMLFFTFIQISFIQIRHSFSNRTFTIANLVLNFVWTPLFAWVLANLFLSDQPALWIGLIMLMVTPCTDWYIIFTGLAKGDVVASLSVLPLNLLLQLTLLPVYLHFLTGTASTLSFSLLLNSLVVMTIPLGLAIGLRHLIVKLKHTAWIERISILPILLLCLAVISIFASQGQLLLDHVAILSLLLIPLCIFFTVNFVVSRFVGQRLKFERDRVTSLQMTTLARNSPIALAIATTAFPNEPLIALALVIGPLLELPILVLVSYTIQLLNAR